MPFATKIISRALPSDQESLKVGEIIKYRVILKNDIVIEERLSMPGGQLEFTDLEVGEYEIICSDLTEDGIDVYEGSQKVIVESGITSKVTLILENLYTIAFKNSATGDIFSCNSFLNRPFNLPDVTNIWSTDGYTFEKLEYNVVNDNGEIITDYYYLGDEFILQNPSYNEIKAIYKRNPTEIGYIAYNDNTTSKNFTSGKIAVGIVLEVDSDTKLATKIMNFQEVEDLEWNTNYNSNLIDGISDKTDGYSSRALFIDNDYPTELEVLQYANNLHSTIEWYVPAQDELLKIYDNMGLLNSCIDKLSAGGAGAVHISKARYWSCSYYDNYKMVVIDMNATGSFVKANGNFTSEYRVRCVARFTEVTN